MSEAYSSVSSSENRSSTNPCPETVLPENSQRIIGLTGGIGMGKSTVSEYLEKGYDLPVLDADILARDAVAVGTPIFNIIVERYGPAILLPDGTLNRQQLGNIIFNLAAERLWLDQQIHPYVRDRFEAALASEHQSSPMVILAVPLLFEARMTDLVNEIWVVHCSRPQQIERLLKRSHQSGALQLANPLRQEQVEARINAQLDIQKKIDWADVVLDNSGSQHQLFQAIDQILQMQAPRVH
ncbi:MAG: dephospho-CoA kinase [Cyanobacteria bacterium P01_F01_bin.150]